MSLPRIEDTLALGVAAAQQGKRAEARRLLEQVVEADPAVVDAWWWLSEIVDDDQERVVCLENILTLNPEHAEAQARLEELRAILPDASPSVVDPVDPSLEDPFQCVYCGQPTDVDDEKCPHCRGRLTTHERVARRHTPALIAALLVVAMLATWSGVEAFGAMLRLSRNATPPTTVQTLMDTGLLNPSVFDPASLLGHPLMRAVFGDVLSLDYVLARRLFMAGNARLALLIVLTLVLYLRWTPGYYGTLAAILTGLVWDLFQVLNRYTGWLAGLVGILLGLLAILLLFRAEDNFALRAVRLQVRMHPAAEGAAGAHYWGRQYAREGKHALAAFHFRRAVGRAPGQPEHYKRLAMSYAQIGRFGHSLRVLEQAYKLNPEDDDVQQLQALVREKLWQAQVRQAKRQASPRQM